MASFNKVLLMGNLTRDPQVKQLPSNTTIAEFGIACNRRFKSAQGEDRDEVTFVDVVAFGKPAEVVAKFFTKGKPIFIEGRLKYDQWEDKNGGGKRHKLSVIMEGFQFVGGRDSGGGGESPQDEQPASATRQATGAARAARGVFEEPAPAFNNVPEDDIPF